MTKEKVEEALIKIEDQISLAERFLGEDRVDEALYFIWLAAENLVNTLKIAINGFYVKDHREKSLILREYYALGYINKDYSEIFEKLAKFRITAEFYPLVACKTPSDREEIRKGRWVGNIYIF